MREGVEHHLNAQWCNLTNTIGRCNGSLQVITVHNYFITFICRFISTFSTIYNSAAADTINVIMSSVDEARVSYGQLQTLRFYQL